MDFRETGWESGPDSSGSG